MGVRSCQLELFDFDIDEPLVMPSRQAQRCAGPPVPDRVAAHLRQRAAYASPRERQGVVHRSAMVPFELAEQMTALRRRAQSGDPEATLISIALLIGVPPTLVADAPLHSDAEQTITLDTRRGWVSIDFARVFLGGAAKAASNETALPATPVLQKPLPVFLAERIRDAIGKSPGATRLGDLFGDRAPVPHEPVDGERQGRLRTTTARLLHSLGPFALRQGLDRYDAALLTGDVSLLPKSRFFYVRCDPDRYLSSWRTYFDALGWGEPVPLEMALPFGSQAVPAQTSVALAYRQLRERIEAASPGRRYTLDDLIEHHNHFMIGAAWLLSFSLGSRQLQRLDFSAGRCIPGVSVMAYSDKRTGSLPRVQPVLLCGVAQRQVIAIWDHLVHLCARADKLGVGLKVPWRCHLSDVLNQRLVPLLFLVNRRGPVAAGTRHVQLALDRAHRLAPNAGRHFWQTTFVDRGTRSEHVDLWARHSNAGMEPMTSTSIAVVDSVRASLTAIQDDVFAELGMSAFSGLGAKGRQ